MELMQYHGFEDGVRWRLVPSGVEIEGSGVERTRGAPTTVARVWDAYATHINRTARSRNVPCALIVATICTESSGRADAVRLEPGYVSDERTPNKVSVGLMQTLISTARETMQMSLDRNWLLEPSASIEAGTAYIAQQAKITKLDPPLVAAAYNAGRLAYQSSPSNRWKLRQYPLGTGQHCDRFVRFFNDAVYLLNQHSVRPSVGIEGLCGIGPSRPARSNAPQQPNQQVSIGFGAGADPQRLTPYSRKVLEEILGAANLKTATVSSTSRSPEEQARVMYENLERYGIEHQKKLYARAGDKVIEAYARAKDQNKSAEEIKASMAAKIRELGPTTVSRHASDIAVLNVFDVAPSSIKNRRAFEQAVRADRRVSNFLMPPQDPGYHLEIPQKGSS